MRISSLRSHLRLPPGWQGCGQRDRKGLPASLPPDFSTRWCGSGSPSAPQEELAPGSLSSAAWDWRGVEGFSLHRLNEVGPASIPVHSPLHQGRELKKYIPAAPTEPSCPPDSIIQPPTAPEDSAWLRILSALSTLEKAEVLQETEKRLKRCSV